MDNQDRSFLEEFKSRMKQIDKPIDINEKIVSEIKTPSRDVKKYNIHKRSLPPGIDTIVAFGVTKEEAEFLTNHSSLNLVPLLKTKVYHNDADDSKTLVYFDTIPVDAKPRERSIYYNTDEIIKEDN